jgi:transketolase
MKDYGDPSNVNKVLEIMKKDKPQLINKTSTVGEVEDAVKQNEVDDASINADAITASSEDNIVQPDDLESEVKEPENFDDLEAGIQEPKDWKDMVDKYVQETADKLDAIQKEQKKMSQKLDDLISPPTEPQNTLCEK